MSSLKICSKCKLEKPLDAFGKRSKNPDGLQYCCKECSKEYQRKWRAENPGVSAAYTAKSYQKNIEKRREESRNYAKDNRAKKTQAYREWRYKNPEKQQAASDRHRDYRLNWIRGNKDRMLELGRKWAKLNPDKISARDSVRRKRHEQATPKWLTKEQKDHTRQFYKASKILSMFYDTQYHVDHIEPLKGVNEKGEWVSCGLHVFWNLAIIPSSENMRKSNKLLTT